MRLLVVEDDPTIASFLVKGLQDAGFAVDHATSGGEALNLGSSEDYAVAVVDVMLPGMDGLALIEELRRRRIRTPVIILSAKASVDDRVKGLQAGGDDYLTKPFAFSELLARVQALIRRSTQASDPTRLSVANLTLDLLTREVRRGDHKTLALDPLEPRGASRVRALRVHVARACEPRLVQLNRVVHQVGREQRALAARVDREHLMAGRVPRSVLEPQLRRDLERAPGELDDASASERFEDGVVWIGEAARTSAESG